MQCDITKARLNFNMGPDPECPKFRVHLTRLEAGVTVSTINRNLFPKTLSIGWETAVLTKHTLKIVSIAYELQYVEMMHRRVVEQLITRGEVDDVVTYYGTYNAN